MKLSRNRSCFAAIPAAGLILASCQGEPRDAGAATDAKLVDYDPRHPVEQLPNSTPWKPVTLKQGSMHLGFENLSSEFDPKDGKLRVPRSDGSIWIADLHRGNDQHVVEDGDTAQIWVADSTTIHLPSGGTVIVASTLAVPEMSPGQPPKDTSLQMRVSVMSLNNRSDRTTVMLTLDQSIVGIAGLRVRPVEGSSDRALIIVGTEVVLVKLE